MNGKVFSKLEGTKRASQLEQWKDGDESTWRLCISNVTYEAKYVDRHMSFVVST